MKVATEEKSDLPKMPWTKPEVIDLDQDSGDIENGNPPFTTVDGTFAGGS